MKVDPWPSADSTSMVPSCPSTIACTMDRPETGALDGALGGVGGPEEAAEHLVLVLLGDPVTAVAHHEAGHALHRRLSSALSRDSVTMPRRG